MKGILAATPFTPNPDRFGSNPTPANGVWIVATMPSRIQSDLEAVSKAIEAKCAALRTRRSSGLVSILTLGRYF